MPGIIGVVSSKASQETKALWLDQMIDSVCHYPWYRSANKTLSDAAMGSVVLGHSNENPQCFLGGGGRYLIAFEGELINATALRRYLGLAESTLQEMPAQLVLCAMIRWGTRALKRLNGLFQVALWDSFKQELLVACDPGGLRPVYYAHQGSDYAFAHEIKPLLQLPWVSRDIDFEGILSFLRYGLPLGNRTFFKDIKVMPAGSVATFHQGQQSIQRYWKLAAGQDRLMKDGEMKHNFLETWQEVMQDQVASDDHLGVLLSGGVDSRLILAALAAQGKVAQTFTIGDQFSEDHQIARTVAAASAYSNHFMPITSKEVTAGLERAVYLTDGHYNCFHAHVSHVLSIMDDRVTSLFDGINALDSLYDPEDIYLGNIHHRKDATKWIDKKLERCDIRRFPVGSRNQIDLIGKQARDSFDQIESLDFVHEFLGSHRAEASNIASILDAIWFEEYQHRFSFYGPHLLRSRVNVRCPLFDKRILALIPQMQPVHRSSDKPVQRYAIHQLSTSLAAIPWERTGLSLTAGFLKTFLRRTARYFYSHGAAYVDQRFGTRLNRAGSKKLLDYDIMLQNAPELQTIVRTHLIDEWENGSRLFDKESLQALLSAQVEKKGNFAEMIGRILTIELWYKQFVLHTSRCYEPGRIGTANRTVAKAA